MTENTVIYLPLDQFSPEQMAKLMLLGYKFNTEIGGLYLKETDLSRLNKKGIVVSVKKKST